MDTIGVISDIHGNPTALEKALAICEESAVERIFVCGDVVGYGRQPNECCDRLRKLGCVVVAGNHDWAVAGLTEYKESHSERAVKGIDQTRSVITPSNLEWLKALPLSHRDEEMEFVHSSLEKPADWLYLTNGGSWGEWQDVRECFNSMEGTICFVGHSHAPALYMELKPKQVKHVRPDRTSYELGKRKAVVCVGSVGAPSSRSEKGSVVIYDRSERRVRFIRFKIRKESSAIHAR